MSNQPFYAPSRKPAPARQPEPGELVFEFTHGRERYRCELRDRGQWGAEAQFFSNGKFWYSRRFDTRAGALAWAAQERQALEKGWVKGGAQWT